MIGKWQNSRQKKWRLTALALATFALALHFQDNAIFAAGYYNMGAFIKGTAQYYLFTTNATYANAAFGLAQADRNCTAEANSAGLSGYYYAILSTQFVDAKNRFNINGPVNNTNSQTIATGATDLWDGTIGAIVRYDAAGVLLPATPWTGSTSTGLKDPSGYYCSGWTTSAGNGMEGWNCATNNIWIAYATNGCTGSGRGTYCLGPQSSPGSHTVFTAHCTWLGNSFGSISGADAQCQSLATGAGRTGTWKAIMSDASTDAKDRIAITGPIYNTNNQLVAIDAAGLWSGTLCTFINYDQNGTNYSTNTWTGTNTDGTKNAATCGNWSNSSSAGIVGSGGSTSSTWVQGSAINCGTNSRALFCIDQ